MKWLEGLPVVVRRELIIEGWIGMVRGMGEVYLSDGNLMFRSADVDPEIREALERTERGFFKPKDRSAAAHRLWETAVAEARFLATFKSRGLHEELTDAVFLAIGGGPEPLILDPKKLALAVAAVGPIDEIRAQTSNTAAVLYRGDDPRAVIMPRRP